MDWTKPCLSVELISQTCKYWKLARSHTLLWLRVGHIIFREEARAGPSLTLFSEAIIAVSTKAI